MHRPIHSPVARKMEMLLGEALKELCGLPPKSWTGWSWFERKETMQTNKPYTDEFKRSVVEHWLESGKSVRKVAEEFGVKQWNLRDWRFKFGPAPKGPEDPMPESPEAMQRELQRLRKELARVTSQREILKKTLGIVSEV